MKKIINIIGAIFLSSQFLSAYFDGGINYTTGKDGYNQKDIYLLIGKNNWWIKPSYSSWNSDNLSERFDIFGAKLGIEKNSYTLGFGASYTPEKNNYKNLSLSSDITFSLNPTSSNRKRLAGPNSGFVSRSASGVTQIDLGAGLEIKSHRYTASDTDLKEITMSVFAGAKVFVTNLSINYSVSSYDNGDLSKTQSPGTYIPFGMTSYFGAFSKSNFNFKIDIPGSVMVTPFASYNRIIFTDDLSDNLNVYSVGAYIDLSMVGATVRYETYKMNSKRYNYLSASAGLRF